MISITHLTCYSGGGMIILVFDYTFILLSKVFGMKTCRSWHGVASADTDDQKKTQFMNVVLACGVKKYIIHTTHCMCWQPSLFPIGSVVGKSVTLKKEEKKSWQHSTSLHASYCYFYKCSPIRCWSISLSGDCRGHRIFLQKSDTKTEKEREMMRTTLFIEWHSIYFFHYILNTRIGGFPLYMFKTKKYFVSPEKIFLWRVNYTTYTQVS